jgi:UDP-glucose 4-epimerase
MKVLLIGGCGFVGSHVADALLERELSVRILDKRPEPFRPPLPLVEYVFGDFGNTATLTEALDGIDAVVHLASTTVPGTADRDPVADIEGNLIATVRLLQAMRASPLRKIIYLSSGGTVYGVPETDPVPETHPLRPINSYGIVKLAVEHYLYQEYALHGQNYVVLRASNPYGPRQGQLGVQGIIGTHLWKSARHEALEVWGDGSVVRDFVHVRDLARLCVDAVLSDVTGCFNAGSGTGTSIQSIVDAVRQIVGKDRPEPPEIIHKPGRPYDVPRIVLDITSAQQSFGWSPQIALDQGLAETWEWVRTHVGLQVTL